MPDPDEVPKERADWVALVGVVVTVILHLILQADGPNAFFIITACLFWSGFVAVKAIRNPKVFRQWGLTSDNLLPASVVPGCVLMIGALGLGIYAHLQGQLRFPLHTLLLLLLYPLWGVAQQLLTLGITIQNLECMTGLNRWWILTLLGATLFGLVHAPDWWAVAATFVLELMLVPVFLRYRNLWPLGIVHGWLGAIFYLWGMGRDMWLENFG